MYDTIFPLRVSLYHITYLILDRMDTAAVALMLCMAMVLIV